MTEKLLGEFYTWLTTEKGTSHTSANDHQGEAKSFIQFLEKEHYTEDHQKRPELVEKYLESKYQTYNAEYIADKRAMLHTFQSFLNPPSKSDPKNNLPLAERIRQNPVVVIGTLIFLAVSAIVGLLTQVDALLPDDDKQPTTAIVQATDTLVPSPTETPFNTPTETAEPSPTSTILPSPTADTSTNTPHPTITPLPTTEAPSIETYIAATQNAQNAEAAAPTTPPSFTPIPASPIPDETCYGVVVSESSTIVDAVRQSPNNSSNRRDAVRVGERYKVTDRYEESNILIWYKIVGENDLTLGWIPSQYLQLSGNCLS